MTNTQGVIPSSLYVMG